MDIWRFNAFFPLNPRGLSLSLIISFPFAILFYTLRPLQLVTTQQFFSGMHDLDLLVVECCTKSTLSDDNSRRVRAVICRNSSHCLNHFRTPFLVSRHLDDLVMRTKKQWIPGARVLFPRYKGIFEHSSTNGHSLPLEKKGVLNPLWLF